MKKLSTHFFALKNQYKENSHKNPLIKIIPTILIIFTLLLLTVLFRMQRIELDYKYYELNQKISKANFENKELKAEVAQLLSIKNLGQLSKKFHLEEPKEDQIIMISTNE